MEKGDFKEIVTDNKYLRRLASVFDREREFRTVLRVTKILMVKVVMGGRFDTDRTIHAQLFRSHEINPCLRLFNLLQN